MLRSTGSGNNMLAGLGASSMQRNRDQRQSGETHGAGASTNFDQFGYMNGNYQAGNGNFGNGQGVSSQAQQQPTADFAQRLFTKSMLASMSQRQGGHNGGGQTQLN